MTNEELPPPEPAQLERVAELVAGRAQPFRDLPPAMRESLQLAQYAVAAAGLLASGTDVPSSRAALIGTVIRRAFGGQPPDDPALRRLAVQSLTGDSVRAADVDPSVLAELRRTRIVTERGGRVEFSLAVVRDWYAARAVVTDSVLDTIELTDVTVFERWRAAIAFALDDTDAETVDRVAETVARIAPGGLRLVVAEATSRPTLSSAAPGDDPSATGRLTRAVRATAGTLAPLSTDPGGLGIDVTRSTAGVRGGMVQVTLNDHAGRMISEYMASSNAAEPAWPWLVAGQALAGRLADVLRGRRLPAGGPIAAGENAWAVAARLARAGRFAEVIDAASIEASVAALSRHHGTGATLALGSRSGLVLAPAAYDEVLELLLAAVASGEPLRRPWPAPDRRFEPGVASVDDLYSTGQAVELVRYTLEGALSVYTTLVERWIPGSAPFLGLHAMLPAICRCVFRPAGAGGFSSTWAITWHPLPVGASSEVIVATGAAGAWPYDRDHLDRILAEWDAAGRAAPPFTRSLGPSVGHIHAFTAERPAVELAYDWLTADLADLGWSTR